MKKITSHTATLSVKLFSILFLLISISSSGHYSYHIKDPKFARFLRDYYPSFELVDKNDFLDIEKAQKFDGKIQCANKDITSLDGIEYFEKLSFINCSYNNISDLEKLSKLTDLQEISCHHNQLNSIQFVENLSHLRVFDCSSNQLKSTPNLQKLNNLTYLNLSKNNISNLIGLEGLIELQTLIASNNNLQKMPVLTNSIFLVRLDLSFNEVKTLIFDKSNQNIETLNCEGCELSEILNIKNLINLRVLNVSNNKLKEIESINSLHIREIYAQNNQISKSISVSEPFLDHINLEYIDVRNNKLKSVEVWKIELLKPKKAFVDQQNYTTLLGDTIVINNGESTELKFEEDIHFDQNTYTWYKDNKIYKETKEPSLKLSGSGASVFGEYYCIIKNEQITKMEIRTNTIVLIVKNCQIDNFPILTSVVDHDCKLGAEVLLRPEIAPDAKGPFKYQFRHNQRNTIFDAKSGIIKNVLPGTYDLLVTDQNNCTITFSNQLEVDLTKFCEKTFSPDGDGVYDDFFISPIGITRIFNTEGELIQELETPANWDGSTSTGDKAQIGLYFIITNDDQMEQVTLLY